MSPRRFFADAPARDEWNRAERTTERTEKPPVPPENCVAGLSCGQVGHARTVLRCGDPITLSIMEAAWECPQCHARAVSHRRRHNLKHNLRQ
jgi:hypothetical protein